MLSAFLVYGFLCNYVSSFSLCFVISIRSLLCSVKFILTCYVPFYCDGPPSHHLCSLVFPVSKLNSIIVSHQRADSVLTLYHWSMALINSHWSVPFTELGNDCNHNVVKMLHADEPKHFVVYLPGWLLMHQDNYCLKFPCFLLLSPTCCMSHVFLGSFCAFLVFAWSELFCIMYFLYFTVTIELLFSLSFVPESCIWVLLCLHYCPWEEESFKKSKWIRLLWTN